VFVDGLQGLSGGAVLKVVGQSLEPGAIFGLEGDEDSNGNINPFLFRAHDQIISLAARYGLPAIYPVRGFVDAGGLMSYSPDRSVSWHQAGLYAARILHGEKPADLPVQRANKVELVINLKTSKALGLNISASTLARADEVIE